MRYQLKKLQFDTPAAIDKLSISQTGTLALTSKEGGVSLYSPPEFDESPVLLADYQDHKGPVMDLVFGPATHEPMLLTCSYDRSVSLRSMDAQLYSYKETDASMGFFVSCCFVQTKTDTLRFLAGNSNGHLFDFDSRGGFQPVKHALFGDSIAGIGAIDDGCVVVCVNGHNPRIYVDKDFQDFVEVESDMNKGKYKAVRLTGDKEEGRLLLVSESNQVEVYRFNRLDHSVVREAEFKLDQRILSGSWNFSGHSANLITHDDKTGDFGVVVLKEDLERPGEWSMTEISGERLE